MDQLFVIKYPTKVCLGIVKFLEQISGPIKRIGRSFATASYKIKLKWSPSNWMSDFEYHALLSPVNMKFTLLKLFDLDVSNLNLEEGTKSFCPNKKREK